MDTYLTSARIGDRAWHFGPGTRALRSSTKCISDPKGVNYGYYTEIDAVEANWRASRKPPLFASCVAVADLAGGCDADIREQGARLHVIHDLGFGNTTSAAFLCSPPRDARR